MSNYQSKSLYSWDVYNGEAYAYETSVGRNVTGDILRYGPTSGVVVGNTGQTFSVGLSILGTLTDGIYISGTITDGVHIGAATTGINLAGAMTTGLLVAGTATDGISITGICADAIHISGANTATGLHISGNQVDAILVDGDAAADNVLKVSVDDGITIGVGINLDRTGTTGVITTGISIDTDGTTGIEIAAGFTGTTGISIAGTSTNAIAITGNATTAISVLTGTFGTGLSLAGTLTTGINIAACTTGMLVAGANATGISFTASSSIALINANAAAAHGSVRGIFIGEDANTEGSGIALNGAAWATSQGNALYSDDGGVAATGYTETMTVRHLMTINVTTGDVSFTAFHPDLYLNASYTGSGGLSAMWANTTIVTGKTINTSGGLGDVGGATFGLDLPVGAILAASSFGCGVSVGGNLGGTHTGIVTAYRVRNTTAGNWDGFLSIGTSGGPNGCLQAAAAGVTQDQHLKVYVGTTLYTIPMYTA